MIPVLNGTMRPLRGLRSSFVGTKRLSHATFFSTIFHAIYLYAAYVIYLFDENAI
jgi:hypothetical protein